jgi:hypothetical protein
MMMLMRTVKYSLGWMSLPVICCVHEPLDICKTPFFIVCDRPLG